jgi:predicted TIM-barrel enzyme
MVWPQYWDEDQRLRRTFGVTAIPTYVLIDGEGIVQLRVAGSGFDQERTLIAEIDKQVRLAAPR